MQLYCRIEMRSIILINEDRHLEMFAEWDILNKLYKGDMQEKIIYRLNRVMTACGFYAGSHTYENYEWYMWRLKSGHFSHSMALEILHVIFSSRSVEALYCYLGRALFHALRPGIYL